MTDLHISLLGPFEVKLDGEAIQRFDSVKVRALLAYLAAEAGRPQARITLAGLLWPDYPDPSAHKSLRQALYSLRRTLHNHPYIEADRQSITLVPGGACRVDVFELERALAEFRGSRSANDRLPAAVIGLQSAVALYRGPFLQGFTLSDSPEFEAWVLSRREHHSHQVLEALSLLAEWHEGQGELEQAERYTRQQLEIEPWREEAHQHLMRSLARQGKRSQALAEYERLQKVLKEELGVSPSEKTTEFVERIRSGEQSPYRTQTSTPDGTEVRVKPLHNLPVQLTSFIGREKDISLVIDALSQHRLVTLTGHGGIGKTRTAIRVALIVQDAFPDGVWMVDLAPVSDPDRVLQTAARAIGMQLDTGSEKLDAFLNYAHQRQLLLLLDNCEHLIDACAKLCREILNHCPQVKILVTSREILSISGEVVHYLPALTFPGPNQTLRFDQPTQFEAVALFAARAAAVQSHFTLNSANAHHVAQLCAQLDGIPLAIELAAAWTRTLPVDQINRRLSSSLDFLRGPGRDALPRHQTLRACLDWSYNLLTPQEQRLLQSLSVFAGGWTLEAADVVCAEGCDSPGEVLEIIDQLVAKSLVIVERDPEIETRYRLLEPVRQYAQEKLLRSGDVEAVHDRLLFYYKDLAAQAKPHLRAHRQIEWMRRLERELPNIRQAVKWACNEDGSMERLEAGLRMMADLLHFWNLRSRHLEASQGLERLLKMEESRREDQTMPESRCLARANALSAFLMVKDLYGAEFDSYLEECQRLYSQLGQPGRTGYLYTQSFTLPLDQKIASLEVVCADAEAIGEKFLVTECLYMIGNREHILGNLEAAKKRYKESIKLTLEIGDIAKIPVLYIFLGNVAYEQGDLEEARKYIRDAREVLKQIENDLVHSASVSYANMGDLNWSMGDYDQAVQCFQLSYSAESKTGHPPMYKKFVQAGIYLSQGNPARAKGIIDEVQQNPRRKYPEDNLWVDLMAAYYAAEVGDQTQASMYFKSVMQAAGDYVLQKNIALTGLAFNAYAEGDLATMASYLVLAIQHQLQNPFHYYWLEDVQTRVRLTGVLAASHKLFYEAARLLGASERVYQYSNKTFPLSRQKLFEQTIANMRLALDEKTFAAAWEKGKEMDLNQALQYALDVVKAIQTDIGTNAAVL